MYEIPVRENVVRNQPSKQASRRGAACSGILLSPFYFPFLPFMQFFKYTGIDINTQKQDFIISLHFVIFEVIFYPEDRSSIFLRNIDKCLPYCAV